MWKLCREFIFSPFKSLNSLARFCASLAVIAAAVYAWDEYRSAELKEKVGRSYEFFHEFRSPYMRQQWLLVKNSLNANMSENETELDFRICTGLISTSTMHQEALSKAGRETQVICNALFIVTDFFDDAVTCAKRDGCDWETLISFFSREVFDLAIDGADFFEEARDRGFDEFGLGVECLLGYGDNIFTFSIENWKKWCE